MPAQMDPILGHSPRPTPRNEAEQQLLAAFAAGDAESFPQLVRPHLPALLALARRHVHDPHWAEDLLQETLVRAYRGLPGFRGESALRTWLFRILVRLAAEPSRWRLRESAQPLHDREVPDHLTDQATRPAMERELWQRLDEAMERLTPRQRSALHLRAVEGMDYRAIGAILECSDAAARMLVLEARKRVMLRLGEHLEP